LGFGERERDRIWWENISIWRRLAWDRTGRVWHRRFWRWCCNECKRIGHVDQLNVVVIMRGDESWR
jgi:hypothetical protein